MGVIKNENFPENDYAIAVLLDAGFRVYLLK
jgi:hypothetical protein